MPRPTITLHVSPTGKSKSIKHQSMNGPAPSEITETSRAHHGQSGAGVQKGSMDINTDAPRGIATEPHPVGMDSSMNQPATLPSESTAMAAEKPAADTSVPAGHPTVNLSSASPADEVMFEGSLLLCTKAYVRSEPHATQDLFDVYDLKQLEADVARKDLVTGAKINVMRKTYAGHIKTFHLAGKNKVIPHSEGGFGMSLKRLSEWPQSEWENQHVSGKDVKKGLPSATIAKLEKALKLEPGKVPKNDEWESILALNEEKKVKHVAPAAAASVSRQSIPGTQRPVNQQVHVRNGNPKAQAEGEVARPKRAGKKRSYTEDNYEGYGDGFVDDEDGEGYSSGGSRQSGVSKKKRRKEYSSMNSPLGSGVGGYTAGLMGQQHVGRGIGAFGGR